MAHSFRFSQSGPTAAIEGEAVARVSMQMTALVPTWTDPLAVFPGRAAFGGRTVSSKRPCGGTNEDRARPRRFAAVNDLVGKFDLEVREAIVDNGGRNLSLHASEREAPAGCPWCK
jgi:hypothetical protein